MDWIAIAVGASSGLFAGYATNKFALKMLFWPRRRTVAGFGVFPANQARMAEEVGRTVSTQVLTQESLRAHLTSPALRTRIHAEIEAVLDSYMFRRYATVDELVALAFPEEKDRQEVVDRVISLASSWIASLASNTSLRAVAAEAVAAMVAERSERRVDDLLPGDFIKVLHSAAQRLLGVVQAHGPTRIKDGYRQWLASPEPLSVWIGRIDPALATEVATQLAAKGSSLVVELASNEDIRDRLVNMVDAQVAAAMAGSGKGLLAGLRQSLLRGGWSFVRDDALERLRASLPDLAARTAEYLQEPEAREHLARWIRTQVVTIIDRPVAETWQLLPDRLRRTLFERLDHLLDSPRLWELISEQLRTALSDFLALPLRELLPISSPRSHGRDSVGESGISTLPPGTVAFVVAEAPTTGIRCLLGLPADDSAACGVHYGSDSAPVLGPSLRGRLGLDCRPQHPTVAGSWTAVAIHGDMQEEVRERVLSQASAVVVFEEALLAGGWLSRGAPEKLLPFERPVLLVQQGVPDKTEVAGRWRVGPSSPPDQLIVRKAFGEWDGTPALLHMLPDGLQYLSLPAPESNEAISALPAGAQDAIRTGARGRLRGLLGVSALDDWLRAALREGPGGKRPDGRPGDSKAASSASGIAGSEPYKALVDTFAGAVSHESMKALLTTAWKKVSALEVGVPAEHVEKRQSEELVGAVTRRTFEALEQNAAKVASSIDVADLARRKVEGLDPEEVESAVGRMSMGAFWWLEVLGGFFGMLAAGGLAWLFAWSPIWGGGCAFLLALVSVLLMALSRR